MITGVLDAALVRIVGKDESGNPVVQIGHYESLGSPATFTRASVAYKQNGQQVAANQPRFEILPIFLRASSWDRVTGSPFSVVEDSGTLPGDYIIANQNDRSQYVEYNFYVPENGSYDIWAHVLAPSGNEDSFYMAIDNEAFSSWNNFFKEGATEYWWQRWTTKNLSKGTHKLVVGGREPCKVDVWAITPVGIYPLGYTHKKLGYGVMVEEGTTNLINNPLILVLAGAQQATGMRL